MAAPKPAPAKTGMAGLFGGQGPTAYINSLYAPQQAQLAQQQAARAQGLQTLVASILAAQAQPRPDAYGAAAQDATSAANAAAASLARANPDAQTQGMLRAIGAPQSQQDAVGAQNNVVFNGQGALGQYVGGALPAGVFAQDQAARGAYESSLPALIGETAIRGLGHLDQIASTENANLATQRMADLQKARVQLGDYVQKNQSLKAAAQKTAFDERFKVGQANEHVAEFNARQSLSVREFNTRQALAVTKAQWQQSNADRSYGLSYSKFVAAQNRAVAAAKRGGGKEGGGITAYERNNISTKAEKDAENFYYGIPAVTRSNGTVSKAAVGAITYQKAIRTLINRYPALGPTGAIKIADSLYQPGEGGRPLNDPNIAQNINSDVLSQSASGVMGGANRRSDVVKAASTYLGVPYKWGGNSPKVGLDCSAFIQQTYRKLGVNLPRTTYQQVKAGRAVGLNQLQPGDAIFTIPGARGPEHVGLYIGNDQVQVSPSTGDVNKIVSLQSYLSLGFVAARRYIGG